MKEYHSEEQSCKDIALKKSMTMTREKLTTYLLGKVILKHEMVMNRDFAWIQSNVF